MKKADLVFIALLLLLFLPFLVSDNCYTWYSGFNESHGFLMAFIKFALLSTLGELLGHRIRKGSYGHKGFGLLPRALVWGLLGLTIKAAFMIFSSGTPVMMEYLGIREATTLMQSPLSPPKVLVAFAISVCMNTMYAPVMMTLHRITDTHILKNGGGAAVFTRKIQCAEILAAMDWNAHWHFVFKKTIPFFWIPAHTVTFLLPAEFRVLFAALLGIVLGVILALAARSPAVAE